MTTKKKRVTARVTTDNPRIAALAVHLEISPEDIREDCNNRFSVRPHTVLDGTSPEKARQLAALVHENLGYIPHTGPAWTMKDIRTIGYARVEKLLREFCPPEAFQVDLHDLVNSLYFLCHKADGPAEHVRNHRDTLREAFAGEEIKDRRTSRQTNNGEYLVLTDSEADKLWEESLESYLDDCCVEGADSPYFDRERWKSDARHDGRGHALNNYDGSEDCVGPKEYAPLLEDATDAQHDYYIFRTN